MKIAIVGSRKRSFISYKKINKVTKKEVEDLVSTLDINDTVVSGGCKGADSWAIDGAIKRGMDTHIYHPFIHDTMEYGEMVQEYYRRNREVVDNSDMVYAFVSKGTVQSGGTWYTINYAKQKGKKVVIL
jgi:predicted Rossmann fold nucleotide-binding protein DprA/Smf involved in DNA uptake